MNYVNTLHAAGVSRRQFKNGQQIVKNVKIVESRDKIWNHHEKCIEISTNMPGIGSLILEIHVKITEIRGSKTGCRSVNQCPPRSKS